jgi:hypothetical protein
LTGLYVGVRERPPWNRQPKKTEKEEKIFIITHHKVFSGHLSFFFGKSQKAEFPSATIPFSSPWPVQLQQLQRGQQIEKQPNLLSS